MRRMGAVAADDGGAESGSLLTQCFKLEGGLSHDWPILKARAERRPCLDQHASGRSRPQERYVLSGFPIFDSQGTLVGYRGKAAAIAARAPRDAQRRGEQQSAYAHMFGQRLDRALRQPLGRIIANADTISGDRKSVV